MQYALSGRVDREVTIACLKLILFILYEYVCMHMKVNDVTIPVQHETSTLSLSLYIYIYTH